MIRFADLTDAAAIMEFIDTEWKADHILARDKDFFLYEHQDGEKINFVLSEDENNVINGLLGFIPSSKDFNVDISTVIWKVSKRVRKPMLGVELLNFLIDSGRFRTVSSIGINEKTIGIYKFLGMYVNKLDHYVLINNSCSKFKIADVNRKLKPTAFLGDDSRKLLLLDKEMVFDFNKYVSNILYKDENYFKKRYFEHPIYKYRVYGVQQGEEITSVIVARIQFSEESKVMRLVDFIGDEEDLKFVTKDFHRILVDENLEYADFYLFGIDRQILMDAGFVRVDPDDESVIIPNYFQPFVRKNITINFFSNTQNIQNLKLFKADGDQDRPN